MNENKLRKLLLEGIKVGIEKIEIKEREEKERIEKEFFNKVMEAYQSRPEGRTGVGSSQKWGGYYAIELYILDINKKFNIDSISNIINIEIFYEDEDEDIDIDSNISGLKDVFLKEVNSADIYIEIKGTYSGEGGKPWPGKYKKGV